MQRIFGKYIECKLAIWMLSLVHLFGDWQPHFWSEICKIEKPENIQSEIRYLLNLLPTLQTGWSSWCTSRRTSRGWCWWLRRSCLLILHMSQSVYKNQSSTISLVVPGKDVHAAPTHHLQQLQGGDHHGQHLGHRDPGAINNKYISPFPSYLRALAA